MAKPEKPKSGFVIKLSNETAQKIADEEQLARIKAEALKSDKETDAKIEEDKPKELAEGEKQNTNLEVTSNPEATAAEKHKTTHELPVEPTSTGKSDDSGVDSNAENPGWSEYAPYITYEGEEAIYTDPSTKQRYTWNQESNSWATKDKDDAKRVYSYEDDTHVYTEADGSKSFWDEEKKAWLPKVDDDFLAFYQMSYGFVDNKAVKTETENKDDEKPKETKKKDPPGVKRKVEPQWFDQAEESTTKVYVSNLPLDINEEDFVNFMQKCGLVERDPSNQKMKVKLYMDKEQNCFKGDALCTYIKIESVDLALKLLDGCDFKGNKIKVEKAHFQLKGEYNPALKPKKKRKKELEKLKKMQQKLFDWRPEKFIGERSKHERIVIVKNLFHPTDFDKDVQLILDYQQDLREECGKSGEVRKVVIYDGHPEGVAQITMKDPEMADAVVALINGRWFGKRQITAEIWDGRTKYRIAETDADINKRIDKWGRFLEGKEEDEKKEGDGNKTEIAGKVEGKSSPECSVDIIKTVVSMETIKTESLDTTKTVEPMETATIEESTTHSKTTEESMETATIEESIKVNSDNIADGQEAIQSPRKDD